MPIEVSTKGKSFPPEADPPMAEKAMFKGQSAKVEVTVIKNILLYN